MSQLDDTLDRTPVVYEGEPLLLAELDNLVVERDVWRYVQRVDNPAPVAVERTVLLGPVTSYFDRWPVVRMDARAPADLAQFNRSLFQNYDQVRRFAFTQSDIAVRIEEDLDVDVIVLLLVDGCPTLTGWTTPVSRVVWSRGRQSPRSVFGTSWASLRLPASCSNGGSVSV